MKNWAVQSLFSVEVDNHLNSEGGAGHNIYLLSSVSVLKMEWLKNLKLEGSVPFKDIKISLGKLLSFFLTFTRSIEWNEHNVNQLIVWALSN